MTATFETFGSYVRGLRTGCALSQRALSDILDVDFSYISKIERAHLTTMPSFDLLTRMAQALHVPAHEMYRAAGKLNLHRLQQIAFEDERVARLLYRIQAGTITDEQWRRLEDALKMDERINAARIDKS